MGYCRTTYKATRRAVDQTYQLTTAWNEMSGCVLFYAVVQLIKSPCGGKENREMTFDGVQDFAVSWSKRNFGEHFGSGYRNLLGLSEEVGELCHAQLKGEQGIRHTPEEIAALKRDAVGDIIIFLCNYCDSQNLRLDDCVSAAIEEIRKRDWSKHHPPQGEATNESMA